MKNIILPVLLFLMFIPFYVNAETCDTDKITIENITIESKSDNVEELSQATANGKSINLNLSMSEVGDSVEYKFIVKNDSNDDYVLDKNSFNIGSEYIDYTFESEDDTNVVKANSSKNVTLKVEYKNKVPDDKFKGGSYNDNKTMIVQLSNENTINAPDTFKNPKTGDQSYIFIILIIFLVSGSLYIILKKRKYAKFMILIIGTAIIIPMSVYAICKCEIKIETNISIKNKKYNPCIYDGEMEIGQSYTNGQYTYIYGMKKKGYIDSETYSLGEDGLVPTSSDGWSVYLTDKDSPAPVTSRLCTSINDKPIVAMSLMFSGSQSINIDFSGFDTSNVEDMSFMFANSMIENLDLSSFITSEVFNMQGMFFKSNAVEIDLNSFDTSNVENMSFMFAHSKVNKLDLKNFNTSFVINMDSMFSSLTLNKLDISSFNTEKVRSMEAMFSGTSVPKLNVNSFDTSNVGSMVRMFSDTNTSILDLSSFDLSNIVNYHHMFINTTATIGYARTQNEADRFNNKYTYKPSSLTFVVKNS